MVHARSSTTKTRQTQRSTKMLRKSLEIDPEYKKAKKALKELTIQKNQP
ncbi:MAG TPA: hypothetical protein PK601_07995 [Methanothermobacter sp.]|nr:hypothetical protein [Methanothermobacter sp.]